MEDRGEHPSCLPLDELGRVFVWDLASEQFVLKSMPDAIEAWEKGLVSVRNPEDFTARPVMPGRRGRRQDAPVDFVLES